MNPIRCIDGDGIEKLVEQVSNMDEDEQAGTRIIPRRTMFTSSTLNFCERKSTEVGKRTDPDQVKCDATAKPFESWKAICSFI